jgi:hypothetical protein
MNDSQQHHQASPALPDDEPLPPPDHPVSIAVARLLANTLSLWGLCRSARCRRNRACMGNPHECLEGCGALLSDDVFDGAMACIEGQCEGLSFDQAFARWPEQLAALAHWTTRIEHNPARGR